MKYLVLAAGLLAVACAPSVKPTVTVADAWCRATPVGALSGACFVTLTANTNDRLVDVTTTAADHVEIHTMTMDGGVMRMRRLANGLALPRGVPTSLSPGQDHLMIILPKSQMSAGGSLPLVLQFAHAPAQALAAPIRAAPAPGAATMPDSMKMPGMAP